MSVTVISALMSSAVCMIAWRLDAVFLFVFFFFKQHLNKQISLKMEDHLSTDREAGAWCDPKKFKMIKAHFPLRKHLPFHYI